MFFRITARDLTNAYASGTARPEGVLERALESMAAADKGDVPLSAFIRQTGKIAAEAAAASAQRWAEGRPLGPLDGVPVAVKDEFDVIGHPTRAGTVFRQAVAKSDADVVSRLRRKGAVVLGKTHMTEIGLGGLGLNAHYATPRNPYNPEHMTGGSSSGSAAAVAAGICPIAVGSDAGGSIRIPAAWCGVYGLKPTYGRIPTSGAALLAWSLDHVGPLAASIDDLAAFLDATSGASDRDRSSLFGPDPRWIGRLRSEDLSELRFAWCPDFADDADDETRRVFHEALDRIREQGATVDAVPMTTAQWVQKVGYITFCAEAAASQHDWLRDHRHDYNLDTRLVLSVGERISALEYLQAQRVRERIRAEFRAVCGAYDAFLNPSTAGTAAKISPIHRGAVVDTALNDRVSRYSFAGTLTGFPCLSIPCGVDASGLPVGLHLTAMPWRDERLLQIGAAVDQVMPPMPAPKVHFEAL
ncbi:MAG: amidase [bacterium]